ncbi:MAG: hypothetical protein WAJ96_13530 [Candidatus Acidiferrum sp.]
MTEQNHLEGALQQLLQERAELDSVIAALQRRLGKPIVASTVPPAKSLLGTSGATPDSVVYRGAFFNLSVTKATEKLLKTYGRPLKTPEILSAFQQAEFEIKGKHKRAAIYTALLRSPDFVKVLPDTWDLAERHPEAAEKKAQERAAKKNKAKKPKKAAPKAKTELKPQAIGELKVA